MTGKKKKKSSSLSPAPHSSTPSPAKSPHQDAEKPQRKRWLVQFIWFAAEARLSQLFPIKVFNCLISVNHLLTRFFCSFHEFCMSPRSRLYVRHNMRGKLPPAVSSVFINLWHYPNITNQISHFQCFELLLFLREFPINDWRRTDLYAALREHIWTSL